MKKRKTMTSIVGTILIFGFSILIASFGSPRTIKPSVKAKKVVAPITAKDTIPASKATRKKIERVEQEADMTDELPENSDDYKTSYWIGSVPELLKDSIHTAGLVFIDSTAFSKVVPANIQEVYINADGVPSIAHFVDSPFFKSMMQNKIRAIVYNNKANDKDEQLVLGLGGTNTFNADFIMIVYKESGLSIIPVGNENMQYRLKRLSVFQASNFELTPINSEKNPNARIAAACYDQPHLYYSRTFARNRVPYTIEKGKLWWTTTHFFDSKSARVLCNKTDPLTVYKLLKSVTIERGQLRARVAAGSGTVTHRESQTYCKSATVGQTWDWKTSLTLGATAKFDIFGIGASFTEKVKGSYGQAQSSGYSSTECVLVGQTFYSNPCAYACCDSELSIDILQDTYEVRQVCVGSIWINYYKVAATWNNAKAGRWTNLLQPLTLRFKYFPSSPLYWSWQETSELYVSLEVHRLDPKCKPRSCYGYTSKQCNQTVK